MPTTQAWCEHRTDDICENVPQSIFTASPLALCDFLDAPWATIGTECLIGLLRGPLKGLENLHAQGFIHCDVHVKNIFVLALDPPEAVLGDFGKTVSAARAHNAHLGPKHTCAPEVDGKTEYCNSIDIWSLGIVFLDVLFPGNGPKLGFPPTKPWWDSTMNLLERFCQQGSVSNRCSLAVIIKAMLAFIPTERPLAVEILRHPIFRPHPTQVPFQQTSQPSQPSQHYIHPRPEVLEPVSSSSSSRINVPMGNPWDPRPYIPTPTPEHQSDDAEMDNSSSSSSTPFSVAWTRAQAGRGPPPPPGPSPPQYGLLPRR